MDNEAGIPIGGKLIVGVIQLANGQRATVWNVQPKAALRMLMSAAEDLRDQIYAENDARILPGANAAPVVK